MNITFGHVQRGFPPRSADHLRVWRATGFRTLVLSVNYPHPGDNRVRVSNDFHLNLGIVRRDAPANSRVALLDFVATSEVVYPYRIGLISGTTWRDRTVNFSVELTAPAQRTDVWTNVEAQLLYGSPWQKESRRERVTAADFPYHEMRTLALGLSTGQNRTPPGVLVDWLRDHIPTADGWMNSPTMPPAQALLPLRLE